MSRAISPPPLKRRRLARDEVNKAAPTERSDPDPDTNTISLYSWNINGIAPFVQRSITDWFHPDTAGRCGQPPSQAKLRDFLSNHDWPTLLLLQEVKINPADSSTIQAVKRAVNRQAGERAGTPEYVVHFSLPTDKHNATGFGRKVYGVCSVIRKDFYDRAVDSVREVEWDLEGRFSVIETRACAALPKLAVVNVYLVNGTDNTYRDSKTGEVVGTRHDRKKAVHTLLAAECARLAAGGYQIVLAGDFNIARSSLDGHPNLRTFPHQHVLNRLDFTNRFFDEAKISRSTSDVAQANRDSAASACSSLGMIDTFRALHPDEKAYSYYPRGRPFGSSCDRVDMILCSSDIGPHCKEACILATPGDRGTSDHVPIHARFDFGC